MDDFRLEWMRNRVYDLLDVGQNDVFEELIKRDDGIYHQMISEYFEGKTENTERPLMFYKLVLEQDEEVEVECGGSTSCFRSVGL